MKSVLTLVTLCLLGLSSIRLEALDVEELQQYRASKSQNALIPPDSSLIGIDANGDIKKPNAAHDGHLTNKGHLLVFVIHHGAAMQDIEYWNRVIDKVSRSDSGYGAAVQYWGICDDGTACNLYQPVANFSIVGYLDPYEMRVVAESDFSHDALLYDDSTKLVGRIERVANPSNEFHAILEMLK